MYWHANAVQFVFFPFSLQLQSDKKPGEIQPSLNILTVFHFSILQSRAQEDRIYSIDITEGTIPYTILIQTLLSINASSSRGSRMGNKFPL